MKEKLLKEVEERQKKLNENIEKWEKEYKKTKWYERKKRKEIAERLLGIEKQYYYEEGIKDGLNSIKEA